MNLVATIDWLKGPTIEKVQVTSEHALCQGGIPILMINGQPYGPRDYYRDPTRAEIFVVAAGLLKFAQPLDMKDRGLLARGGFRTEDDDDRPMTFKV